MNIYLVLSTFPSSPTSFLRNNNPPVFPYNYTFQFNSPLLISTSSIELKCISTVITQTLPLCLRLPSSISQACFWITLQSADYTKRLYLNHLHKRELFQCCTHFSASHSTGQCSSLCLWHCDLKFNQVIFKKFRSYLRSIKSYLYRYDRPDNAEEDKTAVSCNFYIKHNGTLCEADRGTTGIGTGMKNLQMPFIWQ